MISTSTEKEEELGDELMGADVERGFIDLAGRQRAGGIETPCIPFIDFVEFPRVYHEKEGQNKAGNSL
jgi:hypothetical protein